MQIQILQIKCMGIKKLNGHIFFKLAHDDALVVIVYELAISFRQIISCCFYLKVGGTD